ncbi:MAG TPA: hypothetical protein VIF62_19990 [Labilithrix sp.]
MSFRRIAEIASILLFSCAPRRAPVVVETPSAASQTKITSPGWLVWTHRDDGTMKTALVDSSGEVLAEAPSAVIAADGELFALARTRKTFDLAACEDGGGGGLGPSAGEVLSVVRLDADERARPIVRGFDPRAEDGDAGVVHQAVDVVGSVGPRLFTRDNVWTYACGAHGFWSQTSQVVDVTSASDVLVRPDDLEQASQAARDRFVAMAKEDDSIGALWQNGDPGEPQYAAFEPRFDAGQLHLVHVFLADAPYAFGNTKWRSYAVETEVPARVPPELAAALDVPAPVRVHASQLGKDDRFGGFSTVDDAQLAAHTLADVPRMAARPSS